MPDTTYSIKVICGNCGNTKLLDIPKGISVKEKLGITDCEKCGCRELKKSITSEDYINKMGELIWEE